MTRCRHGHTVKAIESDGPGMPRAKPCGCVVRLTVAQAAEATAEGHR